MGVNCRRECPELGGIGMRARFLKLIGVAATIGTLAVLVTSRAGAVASQAPTASAKKPQARAPPALRTPWGEPDLQGIWTDEFDTPLQRATRYASKEFFTDEERA